MHRKHDRLIDIIADHTRTHPEFKCKNIEYGTNTHVIGEVDLLMYNKGVCWAFEIKSNTGKNLRKKGKHQLLRAEQYLPKLLEREGYKVKRFVKILVCGVGSCDYIARCYVKNKKRY